MIGTPFVSRDEILNKRIANRDKRPWEQTGMDEKGHKRFEGAFKGGNVAGYWNTCGSKEGWAPSVFISSRANPVSSKRQTIFDFMDEEDMGDHVAGQTIRTQADFDVAKGVTSYVGKAQDGTIADSVEQRVVGTSYSLIGRKMLGAMKSLKYAEATESDVEKEDNFRISGKRMQDEDDTKGLYYNGPIKAKNNYYGIGYESDGLEGNDEADAFDHMTGTIRKKREIISMDPYEDDTGYNNIEFNEEEIEATINPAKKKTGRQKIFESDFKIPFKEFEVDGSLKMKGHTHALPEVPADFDMFSRKKSATGKPVSLPRTRMDPDRRSTLLGEQKIQQAPRLETQRKFVQPKVEEFSESDIVIELPFSKNSEKMGRFKAYIAENKGQKVAGAVSANMMRGSEIIKEKKEFEELLAKNEKKRKAMSSNYINLTIAEEDKPNRDKEIMDRINELKREINKRKTVEWKPEPLLCRRFGVLDPYEHKPFHKEEQEKAKSTLKDFVKGPSMRGGKSEVEEQKKIRENDGNAFFKEVQASFVQETEEEQKKGEVTNSEEIKEEAANLEEKEEAEQQQLIVSMEKRPEMSLFQSIFDD